MLDHALQSIASELNVYLKELFHSSEDKVLLDRLAQSDGSISPKAENKVVLTLVDVIPDFKSTHVRQAIGYRPDVSSGTASSEKACLNYELHLLITATFISYPESLKVLSASLNFFYKKPLFDKSNTPSLPDEIEKLSLEILNLSYNEKEGLWQSLGLRYMPSVLFRIKMMCR